MANLVESGVNIIGYYKNNQKFAMTCAWLMPCDYDQFIMLLGSQSESANNLVVGDLIGVSALSLNQKENALHYGESHSLKNDKFKDREDYYINGGAILIKDAKANHTCKVVNILHPLGAEEDFLVQVKVISSNIDEKKKFLTMSDF